MFAGRKPFTRHRKKEHLSMMKHTFWLCLMVAVFATPRAEASGPDQQSEVYADWTVRCVKRENIPPCDMVQFAHNKESNEQVMQFSVSFAGKEDTYGVQIILPLGILIQGGVLIRVDEDTDITDFKVTRCEAQGCLVEGLATGKDMEPFKSGRRGIVAVLDRKGEHLVVPVSLNGFTEALNVMSARNRKWGQKG